MFCQVSAGVVGFTVSALLSVYTKMGRPEDGLAVLKRTLDSDRCGIEHLGKVSLGL